MSPSQALLWGLSKPWGFWPRSNAGRRGSPQINAEWGCGSREQKRQEKPERLSVRAEKVQSGQDKGGEQPWNFLVALFRYLKYHITMSNYSSFLPKGHCWVPVCNSLCGVGIYIMQNRKSWYSSSNITSEPDLLYVGLAASKGVANLLCGLDSEVFSTHFSLIVNTSHEAG